MKAMKMESVLPDLPSEIIVEILSWLPLKTLAQSQLVSKEWQALITSHDFMEKHTNRSRCIYLNAAKSPPRLRSLRSSRYIHILDGLLILWNLTSHKHVIWNPATRRILEQPVPHTSSGSRYLICEHTLSFAPESKSYKVVSFFKEEEEGRICCQILTLGQTMTWRRLRFPFLDKKTLVADLLTAFPLGRAVHWAMFVKTGEETVVAITSLDVETESFTRTYIPTGIFRNVETVTPVEWSGKMALCEIVEQDMHLMVLEDYKKGRWCREMEVIRLPFLEDEGCKGEKVQPLFERGGEIWFAEKGSFNWNFRRTFIYTIQTGKIIDVDEDRRLVFWTKFYNYKPTLLTFDGMQPDDELECYRYGLKLD